MKNKIYVLGLVLLVSLQSIADCESRVSFWDSKCAASDPKCPKPDPNLVLKISQITLKCPKDSCCGKDIVLALYDKFGCRAQVEEDPQMSIITSSCLIMNIDNKNDKFCPSGTTAKYIDDKHFAKICLLNTGTKIDNIPSDTGRKPLQESFGAVK